MGLVLSILEAIGKVLYGYSSLQPYQKMKPGPLKSKKVPYSSEWELYHNTISSCSMQIRCALSAMGVDYLSHHINLIEHGSYENLNEWYCERHPGRVVPLLVHNGVPIYNSTDQIAYLMAEVQSQITNNSKKEEKNRNQFRFDSEMSEDEKKAVMDVVAMTEVLNPNMDGSNMSESLGTCIPFISFPLFYAHVYELCTKDHSTVWVFWKEVMRGAFIHFDKKRVVLWALFAFLSKLPFGLSLLSWLLTNLPIHQARQKSRQALTEIHFPKLEKILMKYNLDNTSKQQWMFGGDQCTLADIALIPMFERIEQAGSFDLLTDSNRKGTILADWWAFVKQSEVYRDAVQTWTHDRTPISLLAGRDVQNWLEQYPEFKRAVQC